MKKQLNFNSLQSLKIKTHKLVSIIYQVIVLVGVCTLCPIISFSQYISPDDLITEFEESKITSEYFVNTLIQTLYENPDLLTKGANKTSLYSRIKNNNLIESLENNLRDRVNIQISNGSLDELSEYKKIGSFLLLPSSKFNVSLNHLIITVGIINELSNPEGEITKLSKINDNFIQIGSYIDKPIIQLRNKYDSGAIANNWNFWSTFIFFTNNNFGAPSSCNIDFFKSNYGYINLIDAEVAWLLNYIKILPNDIKKCLSTYSEAFLKIGKRFVQENKVNELPLIFAILDLNDGNQTLIKELKLKILETSVDKKEFRQLADSFISSDLISLLDVSSKISLFFQGRLSFWIYAICSVFILLFLSFIFMILFFIGPDFDLAQTMSNVSEKFSFRKKSNRGYQKIIDSDDEYSSLLSMFELDDTASDSDIKKAYRNLVKQYHPDTSDSDEREKFEKIHKAYERLLDLRKGWFGKGN